MHTVKEKDSHLTSHRTLYFCWSFDALDYWVQEEYEERSTSISISKTKVEEEPLTKIELNVPHSLLMLFTFRVKYYKIYLIGTVRIYNNCIEKFMAVALTICAHFGWIQLMDFHSFVGGSSYRLTLNHKGIIFLGWW